MDKKIVVKIKKNVIIESKKAIATGVVSRVEEVLENLPCLAKVQGRFFLAIYKK